MTPQASCWNIRVVPVIQDDGLIFCLHLLHEAECNVEQWRHNLEPNIKSYLALDSSPFIISNQRNACSPVNRVNAPSWLDHTLYKSSAHTPSTLLSLALYLLQGWLGCLPRRAVLLQSYLVTIIDWEALVEKKRDECGWGRIRVCVGWG